MKDKPENQPAFPLVYDGGNSAPFCHDGITIKEYFVGQVLSGDIGGLANTPDPTRCAEYAINLADAVLRVLAERSKSNE